MPESEKRLLRNSRREALIVLGLWAMLLVWTVGLSAVMGYGQSGTPVRLVGGVPLWVLLGVFAPWVVSTISTLLFCLFVMKNDDLGAEQGESAE